MSPARALPVIALLAALAAAAPAPAPAPAPQRTLAPPKTTPTTDSPDSIDNKSPGIDEVALVNQFKYPADWQAQEQPGPGPGSPRIFSQLVAPLVQLGVNQLLQATNLVGALTGANDRPNAVLTLFSTSIGRLSGGGNFPGNALAN